jgi:uncharacterized protein (AIM24 family)
VGFTGLNPHTCCHPNPLQISCLAACCGGLGLILQVVSGGSWAFLGGYGTIVTKQLAPGTCAMGR